eukprot:PhF_6_TR13591/c1_g1_i3/m.21741
MIIPLFILAIWALGGVSADCASQSTRTDCNDQGSCIWNSSSSKSDPPCRKRCFEYTDNTTCLNHTECFWNKTYDVNSVCLECNVRLCEQVDDRDWYVCLRDRDQPPG